MDAVEKKMILRRKVSFSLVRVRAAAAIAVLICVYICSSVEKISAQGLPVVAPASVGMNAAKLNQIEALVNADIAAKKLPGAVVVDRNVLEWRLDPTSPYRLAIADDPDRWIVLVCNEGYSSSLAARTLQQLGLSRATDLAGGFTAWSAYVAEVQADVVVADGHVGTH